MVAIQVPVRLLPAFQDDKADAFTVMFQQLIDPGQLFPGKIQDVLAEFRVEFGLHPGQVLPDRLHPGFRPRQAGLHRKVQQKDGVAPPQPCFSVRR